MAGLDTGPGPVPILNLVTLIDMGLDQSAGLVPVPVLTVGGINRGRKINSAKLMTENRITFFIV